MNSIPRRSFLAAGAAGSVVFLTPPPVLRLLAEEENEEGFVALFDGKTLNGWHKNKEKIGHGTGGIWRAEDGTITGEQDPPGSGNGGILLTDRKFGDFDLRLEIKPDWGCCSGLFIRSTEKGECLQMMVDYHDAGNVGHIYGEGTGGFNNRPFNFSGTFNDKKKLIGYTTKMEAGSDKLPKAFSIGGKRWCEIYKPDDWNKVRVLCKGGLYPKITTWINGEKITEFDGATFEHPNYDKGKVAKTLGEKGSIAVQIHAGGSWPKGAKCRWKNIRIKELE
jgi:hypothetical protein